MNGSVDACRDGWMNGQTRVEMGGWTDGFHGNRGRIGAPWTTSLTHAESPQYASVRASITPGDG